MVNTRKWVLFTDALESAGIETYDSLQLWGIIAMNLIPSQAKIAPCDQIPSRRNTRSSFQTRVHVDYLSIFGANTEAPGLLESLRVDQGLSPPQEVFEPK
jgi:hypothetical protein